MANVKRVTPLGRPKSMEKRIPKLNMSAKAPEQISADELKATSNAAAEMPARIVNGLMAVNFVRFHPEVEKDKRSFALEFSLELSKEHLDHLPTQVREGYEDIQSRGYRRVDPVGISTQRFDLCLAPERVHFI